MANPNSFLGFRLRGGFIIVGLEFVAEPLIDAIGRPSLARTKIIGQGFYLSITSGLSEREKSVTLYHEILEAMTVAIAEAPSSVENFREDDFERAAYAAHDKFGPASPENINRMLQFYGFREE